MADGIKSAIFSTSPTWILWSLPIVAILVPILYRLSPFHPLAHVPGPYIPRVSSLWLIYHSWRGDEASTVHKLHQQYGETVCTGPNSVDIADGEALHTIYAEKGGFRKPAFYNNFSVDGHKTIFADDDPNSRAPRARAVLPAFSTASLNKRKHVVIKCAQNLTDVMKMASTSGKPVDILELARSFAADSVCEYLFGKPFGALDVNRRTAANVNGFSKNSKSEHRRADGCADFFDIVGRYWYLSPRIFTILEWFRFNLFSNTTLLATFDILDTYADKAVEAAILEKQDHAATYQGRLLEAGFSEAMAKIETKDALLAGIETTGMHLASIIFYLAKYPDKYETLRQEIFQANPNDDEVQSLPYLRGVVQEGMRISMANPTRFPRIVPPGGWHFRNMFFPTGVEVSCSPFELHNNPRAFENPDQFQPERWLRATKEMHRDLIPFGFGARKCIAMNLALMELRCAIFELAKSNVLAGAKCCSDKIEILEWFSIKVVGDRVDLKWD